MDHCYTRHIRVLFRETQVNTYNHDQVCNLCWSTIGTQITATRGRYTILWNEVDRQRRMYLQRQQNPMPTHKVTLYAPPTAPTKIQNHLQPARNFSYTPESTKRYTPQNSGEIRRRCIHSWERCMYGGIGMVRMMSWA